jgi:surfeit locus 1 family protein
MDAGFPQGRHRQMQWLRALLLPGLFSLVGVALLVGLGVWQLERLGWKEALIARLDRRLSAPPQPLPAAATWDRLTPEHDEFRRVAFDATFVPGKEAPLFSAGSAFRPDVSGPGYWIFAPARLPDGHIVMVDRGFVPEALRDPSTRPQDTPSGPVHIVGALRWPEQPGWFTPDNDAGRNLWFSRDPAAMARAMRLGPVAPFYVAQEAPIPPGGVPKPGRLTANLRNAHLQYAITWFGLAGVLAVVFLSWAASRRRAA